MKTKQKSQITKKSQKPEYWRITFPLNLDIVPPHRKMQTIPQQKIDFMIDEFGKSANSAFNIITKEIYPRLILLNKPKKGICPLCYASKAEKKIKSELIYQLKDFEIGEYNNGKNSCVYFKPGKISVPICDCIKKNATAHYRLRKFTIPTITHNTPAQFDITTAGKGLNKNIPIIAGQGDREDIFDSCLQKACEAIKSQERIKEKIQIKIDELNEKILYNQKYVDNQLNLKIKKERDWNNKCNALGNIYKCPICKKKFKKDFYINNKYCDICIDSKGKKNIKIINNFSQKRAIKYIIVFLKKDRKILKREQHKIANAMIYKQSVVRLYEDDYELVFNNSTQKYEIKIMDVTTGKMMAPIEFLGQDNPKYIKKMNLSSYLTLNKNKNCETEIVRTMVKKNLLINGSRKMRYIPVYKLHYIKRGIKKKFNLTKDFMALGIDLGIAKFQVLSLWDNNLKKTVKVQFYNGKLIRRRRWQYAKYRRIISLRNTAKLKRYLAHKGNVLNKNPTNYKAVLKKFAERPEQKYMKKIIHEHTNEIVLKVLQWKAEYKKEIVVVIEDLIDIRENIDLENIYVLGKCTQYAENAKNRKIKRFWKRKNAFITNINRWNYAQWVEYLKYKLDLNEIPYVILPKRFVKMSSTKCNKCGHINIKNRSCRRFECLKCGYQADADFNASVNIAKAYYDYLIWLDNKKKEKELKKKEEEDKKKKK
jgi:transposase